MFTVIHVPGRLNNGSDYMSRQGGSTTTKEAMMCLLLAMSSHTNTANGQRGNVDNSLVAAVAAALSHTEELRAVTFKRVKAATNKDPELTKLREAIMNTDHQLTLPEGLEQYNRYRDRLSVLDDTVMYNRRLVIPVALRPEVTQGLHAAHQGVGSMLARAQQTVFWPGIFNNLEVIRARCRECNVKAPSQAALPPRQLASPEYPFHSGRLLHNQVQDVVSDGRQVHWVGIGVLLPQGSHRKGAHHHPQGDVFHIWCS
jgi:hypothetical protein